MSYTDTYIYNQEREYWWIYLQGSNGDTDIENRLLDMEGAGEGEGEMYAESNMDTYNTKYKTDSQWEFAV